MVSLLFAVMLIRVPRTALAPCSLPGKAGEVSAEYVRAASVYVAPVSRQGWTKPNAISLDNRKTTRKLVDKLRLSQKSLSKPHDILRDDIIAEAEDNNPVVLFRRIMRTSAKSRSRLSRAARVA
jgi:hypothetical protein